MHHRRAAAVIRFSSLGDVLLAGHVPGFLKREDPERRVLFVTKDRYARLLHGHPHVDRVYALEERGTDPAEPLEGVRGSLGDLIAALRREGVDTVVDLHRNWRSSRIGTAFPTARHRLAPKYALRRRLWVYARWLHPEPVPPLLQTYRALAGLPSEAGSTSAGEIPLPWLRLALSGSELSRGAKVAERAGPRGFVLMGVGARWETKRWPAGQFVALAQRIDREFGFGSIYAAEPRETAFRETASLVPEGSEALVPLPIRELAAVAAHARAIVSNDSGVLHLGPALGVPAVGIFGSTVPEFGFARQGPRDEVAEIPLGCRPCGVHGRRSCPLGHHHCMKRLTPEHVLAALERALGSARLQPVRTSTTE